MLKVVRAMRIGGSALLLTVMLAAAALPVAADTLALPQADSAAPAPFDLPENRPYISAGLAYCLLPGETVAFTAQSGDFLPYGTEMRVPDTGEINITVADAGQVTLKGGCRSALLRDTSGLMLYLDEGTAHNLLNRLGSRDFTVVTPALTAGVRGTEFEVTAEADGTAEVQVDTGSVSVDNQLTGEEMTVRAGNAARAALGERLARIAYRREAARELRRTALKALPRQRPDLDNVLLRMEARQAESRQRVDTAAARLQRLQRERERVAASPRRRDRLRLAQIDMQLAAAQRELARREQQLAAQQRWLAQQVNRNDLTPGQRARLASATAQLREISTGLNQRLRPLVAPASPRQ